MIKLPKRIRIIEASDIRLTEKRDQIYIEKESDFLWYLKRYNIEAILKLKKLYYVFEDTDTIMIYDDSKASPEVPQ
ncbi:hypothetical protein LCGC14_0909610 [marine sediment metagenome]|uniref:Uncharacterized protein n=1 Tax=marine sediment metagenome TaxID=412755 RepID=A0A0F9NU25_9ZZZZ